METFHLFICFLFYGLSGLDPQEAHKRLIDCIQNLQEKDSIPIHTVLKVYIAKFLELLFFLPYFTIIVLIESTRGFLF